MLPREGAANSGWWTLVSALRGSICIAERVRSQLYLQRGSERQRRSLVVDCKSSVFPHPHQTPLGKGQVQMGVGRGGGRRGSGSHPGARPSFFTNIDVLASFQRPEQQQDQLLKQLFLHQHESADHTVSTAGPGRRVEVAAVVLASLGSRAHTLSHQRGA